ncbi:MAG: hypothetical protein K0R73_569 [Candidatus Midichloriaceae bacterium]|jgi:hypothetical protein|nr:hypothetical protein [Candidatus Midichloriaceae bacterium]
MITKLNTQYLKKVANSLNDVEQFAGPKIKGTIESYLSEAKERELGEAASKNRFNQSTLISNLKTNNVKTPNADKALEKHKGLCQAMCSLIVLFQSLQNSESLKIMLEAGSSVAPHSHEKKKYEIDDIASYANGMVTALKKDLENVVEEPDKFKKIIAKYSRVMSEESNVTIRRASDTQSPPHSKSIWAAYIFKKLINTLNEFEKMETVTLDDLKVLDDLIYKSEPIKDQYPTLNKGALTEFTEKYLEPVAMEAHFLNLMTFIELLLAMFCKTFPASPLSKEEQNKLLNNDKTFNQGVLESLFAKIDNNQYIQLSFIDSVDLGVVNIYTQGHSTLLFKTIDDDGEQLYTFFDPNTGFHPFKSVPELCAHLNDLSKSGGFNMVGTSDLKAILTRDPYVNSLMKSQQNQGIDR